MKNKTNDLINETPVAEDLSVPKRAHRRIGGVAAMALLAAAGSIGAGIAGPPPPPVMTPEEAAEVASAAKERAEREAQRRKVSTTHVRGAKVEIPRGKSKGTRAQRKAARLALAS